MKSLDEFIQKLTDNLHDTRSVKKISETLEELVENRSFRLHAHSIVSDPNLNNSQKRTQLMYLIRSTDCPELFEFFSEELKEDDLWLFSSDKIDHFDNFVKKFQIHTEEMKVVELITSIPMNDQNLQDIAFDLEKTFNSKVLIDHEVNPNLLGGAKIHIDNMVYDFSLRTRFRQFERQWLSTLIDTGKLTGRYDKDD